MARMDRTPFERGTAVEPRGEPGTYRAHIGEEWNCPIVPHGGLVTATAVRAMEAELDRPDQTLRSVTTVFAAQVVAGPVDIDVNVLRRGRSISQVERNRAHARAARPDTTRSRSSAGRAKASRSPTHARRRSHRRTSVPSFRDPPPPGWERRAWS